MTESNLVTALKIKAKDLQMLNGEKVYRANSVPIILMILDLPSDDSHPHIKNNPSKFALKIKISKGENKRIQNQINKNLKEITIWFDEENSKILKEFI